MRHVDEGTIHAWLDQQVTDPQEVAWITAHLRECATCSARVAEEDATIRGAEALLSSVAPYADGSREAFEALVAGAAQRDGASGHATPGRGSMKSGPYPRWVVVAGWAATITLAIGLGWSARYFMSTRSAGKETPASPTSQQMARADSPDRGPGDHGRADGRPTSLGAHVSEAPSTQPPASRGQRSAPSKTAAKSVQLPGVEAARPVPRETTGEPVGSGTSANLADTADTTGKSSVQTARQIPPLLGLVPSLQPQAAPPPPLAVPFRASENVSVTAEAPVVDVQNARQQAAPPEPSVSQEAPVGAPVGDSTRAAAALPDATTALPAPAAPAAGAGRGGGRGGAGGGRGRGTGTGTGADAGTGVGPGVGNGVGAAATPASPDGLTQGRLVVNGFAINSTERADGVDWLVITREAARERSGMPLYGIDGLTPARTMVNADGSKVRTVYVVNAAEVALLQEKGSPAQGPTLDELRRSGSSSTTTTTAGRTAADSRREQTEAPNRWSSVRGDFVLTLQGADASGLGARVRLD